MNCSIERLDTWVYGYINISQQPENVLFFLENGILITIISSFLRCRKQVDDFKDFKKITEDQITTKFLTLHNGINL